MVIARLARSLVWAAVLTACTPTPVTEIVVVADTDLEVPSAIDVLRLAITDAQGNAQQAHADLAGGAPRPVTLGLVSRSGAGMLDVAAIGELGGVEVVRRAARVHFVAGQTLVLRLDLWQHCSSVECPPDGTCGEQGCRPIEVAPEELMPWSGTPPDLPDAALAEASDAPIAECFAASDCDDGITCTTDACVGGVCEHTPVAAACDDGMACTTDTCDAATGCVYQTDDRRCDDGLACTTDVCDRLRGCVSTPVHSACAAGSYCDVAGGCVRAPTFATIYSTIIATECTPCHTTSPVSGALDMTSQAVAYTSLVGVAASCGAGANTRVLPGDSHHSLLWRKLSGVDLCGAQMPRLRTPLPATEIDQIAHWIDASAPP